MSLTMNVDVTALRSRSVRYRKELERCASGNVAFMNEHDLRRTRANFNSLSAYLNYCQGEAILDAPEYHGARQTDLGEYPEIVLVENEAINDLSRLYEMFDAELVNCPSSRMPNKFIDHDEGRLRAVIARALKFLDTYVADVLPLDLPETSPSKASVADGASGIHAS